MGHDHHFLSRLDRVHDQHTELALSLYRDDELIRRILNMAEVPEAADRIAISLDDERRGPFIIVARDGHFVTCLGEGMTPGTTHVISRARLDDISKYISVLRERMEQATNLTGGQTELLMGSITKIGDAMCREKMGGILSVSELIRTRFIHWLYRDLRLVVETALGAHKALARKNVEGLRIFWSFVWGHAHLHAVCGAEWQPGEPDPLTICHPGTNHRVELPWCAAVSGWMPLALRGVRTAALGGDSAVDAFAAEWFEGSNRGKVFSSLFALVAIAARDRSLAGDIRRILSRTPGRGHARADVWESMHARTMGLIESTVDAPDEAVQSVLPLGRELIVNAGIRLPKGSLARYERAEDVPDELAMTALANHSKPNLDDANGTQLTTKLAAWAGRASAEDFYFPHDYLDSLRPCFTAEKSKAIAACFASAHAEPPKARAVTQQAQKPNDPCACGSGKKFKRCCGSVVKA